MAKFICAKKCYAPVAKDAKTHRLYEPGEELDWQPCRHFEPVDKASAKEAAAARKGK